MYQVYLPLTRPRHGSTTGRDFGSSSVGRVGKSYLLPIPVYPWVAFGYPWVLEFNLK